MTKHTIQPTTVSEQGEGVERPKTITEQDKKINREDGTDVAELANQNKKFDDAEEDLPAGVAGS